MRALFNVPAPAKLNLFLHVTGRREDGYHLLESAFMLIDWMDVLHFELRTDGRIHRQDLGTALPADDLIVRAARLLQSATGCTLGADIGIDKRIPAQAGMGGGSSDAATTLMALNRLWKLGLGRVELMRLGLMLGADVPFFVFGRNAWVTGIGEQLQAIELPPARFLVVKPDAGLETRQIFSSPNLKRDRKPSILLDFAANAYRFGCNDLQSVAEALCPDLRAALMALRNAGLDARMTGSGSAVFAQIDAAGPKPVLPDALHGRVCNNLSSHPLLGWL